MALNQFPYTNVHELNLDWIISKVQELETRLEAIEDYGEDINELKTALQNLENALEALKSSVNASVLALNIRCNNIEDQQDNIEHSVQLLYQCVADDISRVESQFDAFNSALTALRVYNDTSNTITLNAANAYTQEKVRELLEYFSDPKSIYVHNPWTGDIETIQAFINFLYDLLDYAAMTAQQFDDLGLTAEQFDALGISCEEFDTYGKWSLYFNAGYVTSSELDIILAEYTTQEQAASFATKAQLENYATLNDVKVINPVTGLLGSMQDCINSLVGLHQNGLTCTQFDGANLTATEFDALNLSAFEFDFYGVVQFYNASIISLTTGITSEQYQNIVVGAGGQLFTTV